MENKKVNFTKDFLGKLEPKVTDYEIMDTRVAGLRLRVGPGGSKTFCIRKKQNGKQCRYKIGRFPFTTIENARTKAIEVISRLNNGENINQDRREKINELTVCDLWQKYYSEHLLRNTKGADENKKMIEKNVLPFIGKDKLSVPKKADIKEIHINIAIRKERPAHEKINYSHADRVISILSAMYNFGIEEGYYAGSNPCVGVKKGGYKSRSRFLNKDEIRSFIKALNQEPRIFQDFFLLLLLTGARKTNVLEMKWADIDLKLRHWKIPHSQTKNGDVNIVVLSKYALQILAARKTENEKIGFSSIFVFNSDRINGNLKSPKQAFERIRSNMKVPHFTMHDLRRTFASYMAISGASLHVIGNALNHHSPTSTKIYARLSQNPVENAVNKAARIIMG